MNRQTYMWMEIKTPDKEKLSLCPMFVKCAPGGV